MTATPPLALEILCDAWALIEDPARWCQGEYARDADGRSANPHDPRVPRRCAAGALYRANPLLTGAYTATEIARDGYRLHYGALNALGDAARALYSQNIPAVNDDLGHAAVERCYALAVAVVAKDGEELT